MRGLKILDFSVGLFMLAGILGLVVLALQVSEIKLRDADSHYLVSAYFNNIGSLSDQARVSMSGVTIGKVTAIELDKKTLLAKVTLHIDSRFDSIPEDSTISILTSGLLGGQYLGISPGGAVDSLKDGDRIQDTQSALVLEDLIGKFLLNSVKK